MPDDFGIEIEPAEVFSGAEFSAPTTPVGRELPVGDVFQAREIPAVSVFGDSTATRFDITPDSIKGDEIDPATVFAPQLPEYNEGLTRWESGLNAGLQSVSKALFKDFPQTLSILFHKTQAQSKAVQKLASMDIERRRAGLPPLTPAEREVVIDTEESEFFNYEVLENDPVFAFGREMGKGAEELWPKNPELQGEFFADVLPTGAGQIASMILTRGAGRLIQTGVATAQITNNEFIQAREAGATEDEAFQQFLATMPLGILEKLPVNRLLKRIDDMSGGGFKKWLAKTTVGTIEEGVQESIEQWWANIAAKNIYDPTREMFDGVGESGEAGAGVAFFYNAIGNALGIKIGRNRDNKGRVIDPEAEAEMATARTDAAEVVKNNPDLTADDLVDWEHFEYKATKPPGDKSLRMSKDAVPDVDNLQDPRLNEEVNVPKPTKEEWAAFTERASRGGSEMQDLLSAETEEGVSSLIDEIQSRPSFHGADLTDVNLSGLDLVYLQASSANFSGQTINDSKLSVANFEGANFVNSLWIATELNDVNLSEATFNRARIEGDVLQEASLNFVTADHSSWVDAVLVDTKVYQSGFSGASFNKAVLKRVDFNNTDLRSVTFHGASIDEATFHSLVNGGNSLVGADFSKARFSFGLTEFQKKQLRTRGAVIDSEPFYKNLVSTNLEGNWKGAVTEILELFGIKSPTHVISLKKAVEADDLILQDPVVAGLLIQAMGGQFSAAYTRDGGTNYIVVNDLAETTRDRNELRLLDEIPHEVGHLVEQSLRSDPKYEKHIEALREAHRRFKNSIRKLPFKEYLLRYRIPVTGHKLYLQVRNGLLEQGLTPKEIDDLTIEDLSNVGYDVFAKYVTSYDEWFADQFARWVATRPGKRDTESLIGKYMRALYDALKLMADKLGLSKHQTEPTKFFEAWIEKVILKARDGTEVPPTDLRSGVMYSKPAIPDPPPPPGNPPLLPSGEDPNAIPRRSFKYNPDDIKFGPDPNSIPNRLWKAWLKWLAPRGRLDENSYNLVQKERAMEKAEVREAFGRLRELQGEIEKWYPDGSMSPRVEQEMDLLLRGKKGDIAEYLTRPEGIAVDVRVLPDSIVSRLLDARRHIDRLSVALIREGIVEGPLAVRVASNIGQYLHRSYRVHTDPTWAKRVPPEILNRARSFIRERWIDEKGFPPSPRELTNVIDTLLNNDEVQKSLLLGVHLQAQGLDILKPRKGVPAPIRALWGEIEDPIYNYFESVRKIATLLAGHRASTQIREAGKGIYFFPSESMFHARGYTTDIQTGIDDPLRPLANWKTHPEILESLRLAMGQRDISEKWFVRGLLKLNGFVKLGKTALSPLTVMRNFYGGTMFLMANGHNPLRLIGKAPKIWKTFLDRGVNPEKIKWTELGLYDQSLIQGETLDALADIGMQIDERDLFGNLDPFRSESKVRRILKGGIRGATQFYNGIDSFLRISMFEMELEQQLEDSFPDGNYTTEQRAELERQVAIQIRDTYQNYSQIPRLIQGLRKNVLVGPFVSFPYESIRTAINTMSYARREMKSPNPRIRSRGYKRAFSLIATMSAGTTATLASMAWLGMGEDDEDDLNRFMPEWDRNLGKIFFSNEEGKPSYINVGYTFPYSLMERPLLAMFLRGDEGLFETMGQSLQDFFGEFLGLEITTQKILEWNANDNGYGGYIYNENSPLGEQIADTFTHFMDALTPEVINLTVVRPLTEEDFEPGQEALEVAFGLRLFELDIAKSIGFKAGDFNKARSNIRRFANGKIFDETLDMADKVEAVEQANELYLELWLEMREDYEAAVRQGTSPNEIDIEFESRGWSKRFIEELKSGTWKPLEFNLDEATQ